MSFERLKFDKNSFFYQALEYKAKNVENSEKLFKNDVVIVTTALRLLDGNVFKAFPEKCIDAEKIKQYPHYKDFLVKWRGVSSSDRKNTGKHFLVKMYTLEPMYFDSIRSNYYDPWKNNKDFKFPIEFVISFCLACGINDRQYINDAVEAFCKESLDGKGLKKILFQGAIMGCWKFGDIAFDGKKTGMMEFYYEEFLKNPNNKSIVDFLDGELKGDKCENFSNEMKIGTRAFMEMALQCKSAGDFLKILENPKIQCGALYDLMDSTFLVKQYISIHEKELNCSSSSYAYNFVLKSTYSNFKKGRCRQPLFFLELACIFGFTQEEFDDVIRSLHVNREKLYCFDLCANGARKICGCKRNSIEYKNACCELMEKILQEVDLNDERLPTNPSIRSFYNFLNKLSSYTINDQKQ